MNKHLEIVFKILLPALEKEDIYYWIYGGISVAGFAGHFFRKNTDVDIFVKNIDFEKAKLIVNSFCKEQNNAIIKLSHGCEKDDYRPKAEIKINGDEIFSMIPVYQEEGMITFKYRDGNQKYSNQILERVERNISGFKFFTPLDEFIKNLFENHIKARPNKITREEIKKDAEVLGISLDDLKE